ncbi:hypothetical protein GOD17_15360 [Sinorhizobium medicae]|nr:hypothetical protein [Sinorhizobium medicae]
MSSGTERDGVRPKNGAGVDGTAADLHASIVSARKVPFSADPVEGNLERCLAALPPLCRRARITRLGDLTGLDRIGLPVMQAVRPAALSEVTSLGRGFSKAEAAVGALMESLERYFAESIPADRTFLATADQLEVTKGLFENLVVPERRGKWRQQVIAWIEGIDVLSGLVQPVPLELVHTRYSDPPPAHDGVFLRTTTGLACHTSPNGAFLHGLWECLERDAIARAFATHGFFDRMRLAPFGLGDRIDRIRSVASARGISFALWLAPSPASVPVVWCQTIETSPGEPILALPTEGYAAGPSVAAAVASAMLEALSARAGAISGARDDQTREHYRRRTDGAIAKARELILGDHATRFMETPTLTLTNSGALAGRVIDAGLGPVLAISVGAEGGVHCVRTVLPGASPFFVLR